MLNGKGFFKCFAFIDAGDDKPSPACGGSLDPTQAAFNVLAQDSATPLHKPQAGRSLPDGRVRPYRRHGSPAQAQGDGIALPDHLRALAGEFVGFPSSKRFNGSDGLLARSLGLSGCPSGMARRAFSARIFACLRTWVGCGAKRL